MTGRTQVWEEKFQVWEDFEGFIEVEKPSLKRREKNRIKTRKKN